MKTEGAQAYGTTLLMQVNLDLRIVLFMYVIWLGLREPLNLKEKGDDGGSSEEKEGSEQGRREMKERKKEAIEQGRREMMEERKKERKKGAPLSYTIL
jgi:hypothetical protein